MEIRSIQKTGGSSYAIILPKKWVEKNHLTEKNQIQCIAHTNEILILKPHSIKFTPPSVLNIEYLSVPVMQREILRLYVSGVDEIQITSSSFTHEIRQIIRNISHRMLGFELIDSTDTYMIIKNVSTSTLKCSEFVDRMIRITIGMYTDATRALQSLDRNLAKDIIDRDIEVDRLHLTVERLYHIALTTLVNHDQSAVFLNDMEYYKIIAIRLERIADHIVRIASTIVSLKKTDSLIITKFELANLKAVNSCLTSMQQIVLQLDKKLAHSLLNSLESDKKYPHPARFIEHKQYAIISLLESADRIQSYCANIAEETINYPYTTKTV